MDSVNHDQDHNADESPVLDDNPHLSNTDNDFEDLTHSEDVDRHDPVDPEPFSDEFTSSAPVVTQAELPNHIPSGPSGEEISEFEQHHESPLHEVHSRSVEEEGDINPVATHHTYGEEEDDIKGSDISVSSVEEDRTASETSELLKSHMPPTVRNLVYWNCPLTTAGLLISLLLFEFSLLVFSVISVLAYTGLAIMIVSLGLKLYVHFVSSGNSTTIHRYIEADWSISHERSEQVSRDILHKINAYALYTRDLFLINNYGESIKFAIFLYILTYIGAWFNFLTLVILGTVFTFSIPKVYDIYKREIDHVFSLGRRLLKDKWVIVRAKIGELPVIGQKLKRN
jgi:hypothetical protein